MRWLGSYITRQQFPTKKRLQLQAYLRLQKVIYNFETPFGSVEKRIMFRNGSVAVPLRDTK